MVSGVRCSCLPRRTWPRSILRVCCLLFVSDCLVLGRPLITSGHSKACGPVWLGEIQRERVLSDLVQEQTMEDAKQTWIGVDIRVYSVGLVGTGALLIVEVCF